MLLHFVLGYRTFYASREDVPDLESLYYQFVRFLVAETLALHQPESAAHTLEAAVEWLMGALPAVSNTTTALSGATILNADHHTFYRMSLITRTSWFLQSRHSQRPVTLLLLRCSQQHLLIVRNFVSAYCAGYVC